MTHRSSKVSLISAKRNSGRKQLPVGMMIKETGDWKNYRARFSLRPEDEIDFHHERRRDLHVSYEDAMSEVEETVLAALRRAFERGRPYLMFRHGWSTSRQGQMTARSVVRRVMRSKEATPYIVRRECIQHYSVFVAKIKQRHNRIRRTNHSADGE
jgi:hypothetical protein